MNQQWLSVIGLLVDVVGFAIISLEWIRVLSWQRKERVLSQLGLLKDWFDAELSSGDVLSDSGRASRLETVFYDVVQSSITALRKYRYANVNHYVNLRHALDSLSNILLMNPVDPQRMMQAIREASVELMKLRVYAGEKFDTGRLTLFVCGLVLIVAGFVLQLLGNWPGCCATLNIVPQGS